MNGETQATAQLVMKRDDGRSIFDLSGPVTSTSPDLGAGDVTPDRAEAIRAMLTALGFQVEAGNLNTLSITGDTALFVAQFGLDPVAAMAQGAEAHAQSISDDLAPFVADVFVAPPPEFFR